MSAVTPLEFMNQYRALQVAVPGGQVAERGPNLPSLCQVQLGTYFMMNWSSGSDQASDYALVTAAAAGGKTKSDKERAKQLNDWLALNRESIQTAAMGKGAPQDYQLALEWAVRSGKIAAPSQPSIQQFCDDHLGIDCSGFVTNYLAACGKRSYSAKLVRNTSAQSYYDVCLAVNDPTAVRRGDLLVWMNGNRPKSGPGHVAVVEEYLPMSRAAGNIRVVEATGHPNANPKLLDSWYAVERIIDKDDKTVKNDVMILVVKRHKTSHDRVAVIRPR